MSFGGPAESDDPRVAEPPLRISGDAARWDHREGNEDYQQAGDLFRLMSPAEQLELIDNIVGAMQRIPRDNQVRQIGHFSRADKAYGAGVAKGLWIDPADVDRVG